MDLPNIVHPTIFTVNGFRIQIVSYCVLTDEQARKTAIQFVNKVKPKASLKKSVLQVRVNLDKDSVELL